jgi:hypothetical protein
MQSAPIAIVRAAAGARIASDMMIMQEPGPRCRESRH